MATQWLLTISHENTPRCSIKKFSRDQLTPYLAHPEIDNNPNPALRVIPFNYKDLMPQRLLLFAAQNKIIVWSRLGRRRLNLRWGMVIRFGVFDRSRLVLAG